MFAATTNQLRVRHGHEHHRVTYVELFFDLVFVFAITQLSHGLLKHLTPLGAMQTALLLLAVWWVWIFTTWFTNWCDPERTRGAAHAGRDDARRARAVVPRSRAPSRIAALPFALAYVFMQLGRTRVHAVGAQAPRCRELPQLSRASHLVRRCGAVLDRRCASPTAARGSGSGQSRLPIEYRLADRGFLGAGPRPLDAPRTGRSRALISPNVAPSSSSSRWANRS